MSASEKEPQFIVIKYKDNLNCRVDICRKIFLKNKNLSKTCRVLYEMANP